MKRRGLRRGREVENEMRREFKAWEKRPIADIDRADVIALVEAVARRSPWQAHHMLSYASRFFNWCIERGIYGLEVSACAGIRPSRLIGRKEPRQRVLDDDEIRAVWTACSDYPFGSLVRMLLLTGQRRSEVAGMRWSEIDLAKRVWTIPSTRAKSGAAHVVPLTDAVIELLESLPRFQRGDHVFSATLGVKPINGFSKYKQRLDTRVKIAPWVLHDLRRTMRTRLSGLPVPDLVRELVIGHTQKGLHRVYDQHAYLDEKGRALELWSARLREIIEPAPVNVIKLKA
jgi:integrase